MDRKPRVLQICHDYKGPFRFVARQYAGSFSDCDVRTVFLRGPQSESLAATIPGEVDFLTLPASALRGLKIEAMRQVMALVRDNPPDVIVAHRYKPFFIASLLNYQLKIGAVLGVMHEYGFLDRRTRSIYSHFWKNNVHLIAVSEPVAEQILSQHEHLGGRVHVVPNAIEAPTLVDSVTARHELGIPLGAYCYGAVGRLVRKKDHQLLIEAFARLEGDAVLALIGAGELMESLQKQARNLGVKDRVVFSGARDDARIYMKAFDAFVLPSTEEEAFGIVLLEAMAASVPVICSDAKGPASVMGDAGLVFKSGNVEELTQQLVAVRSLSKSELNLLTGKALTRLGEKFSIAAMIRELRNLPPVQEHAPVAY